MSREDIDDVAPSRLTLERPAERYGVTPERRRWTRAWGILGGAGTAAVLIAWLWWAGLAQPTAQFEARDLGWEATGEREISVQFELSVDPGTDMSCAVQALNAQYGIVGWVIADIPASTDRTRVFEQRVRTSETAVTGLLYRCWLS